MDNSNSSINTNNNNKKQQRRPKNSSSNYNKKIMSSSSIARALDSWSSSRTMILRMCFITSLGTAAVVCGLVAHKVIAQLEQDVGIQTYESVAASALENAQAILDRKFQANAVMRSLLAYAYPDASQWPFIALNGYEAIAQQLAALSVTTTQTISVLVQPEQAAEFEAFAKTVYQKKGYPENAGQSNFGFGIWKPEIKKDNTTTTTYPDGRLPDRDGTTSYGSSWNILVPVFLHNNLTSKSLMFNIHSAAPQGRAVDYMQECSQARTKETAAAATTTTTTPISEECDVLTDFIELVGIPGPAALLLQPVYPTNDPTTLVGVSGTSIHWEHILTNVVPNYVDGLDCVIATETASFTFVIQQGKPIFQGPGDFHDPEFDVYARMVKLHDPVVSGAASSATYTLTVYPTARMLDVFRTSSPRVVSLGFVSIILVCIALFFLYDFFMKFEAHQRRQLLEMKRRFVRFISHEIRTPLNCVCMGLELLQDDLREHAKYHHQKYHQQTQPDHLIHLGNSSIKARQEMRNANSDTNKPPQDSFKNPNYAISNSSNSSHSGDSSGSLGQSVIIAPLSPPSSPSNSTPIPVVEELSQSYHLQCAVFVEACLELSCDVYENTKNAVAVLDDLLNYDKIQMGTLKLEVGKVDIWDMLRRTVVQFKLQAQNRKIALRLCIREPSSYSPRSQQQQTIITPSQQQQLPRSDNEIENDANQDNYNDDVDFLIDEESAEVALNGKEINTLGDDMKLSQALRNLISNALKFTSEGGTVTVTASYKSNGLPKSKSLADAAFAAARRSGSAIIRVRDTGAGMSQDQIKLLFQEWVQFDANKLQKGGGSGLGLCITKEIIEQHGGIITAESPGIGMGATFSIELPLYEFPRDDDEAAQQQRASMSQGPSHGGQSGEMGADHSAGATASTTTSNDAAMLAPAAALRNPHQHRILVVEDVMSNRKLLVRLLERAGHTCGIASNGQEAIDCYVADQATAAAAAATPGSERHIPYDTILMDSEMPVLTGPEATKQLREMGCTAAIVGVTGNVLASDVHFFKSQGADEVLPKPVEISRIEDFWERHNNHKTGAS